MRHSLLRQAILLNGRPKFLENRIPQVRYGATGPPIHDTEGDVVVHIVGNSVRAFELTVTDVIQGTVEAAIETELEVVCWIVTDGEIAGTFELDISTEGNMVGDKEGLSITTPDVDNLGEEGCKASAQKDAERVPLGSTISDGDALASDETIAEGLTKIVISVLRLSDDVRIDVIVIGGYMEVMVAAVVDGDGEKTKLM